MAAAMAGRRIPNSGRAKYSQNSCTTRDVPRKSSTYTPVTARTGQWRERRPRPATKATTKAHAADIAVIWAVTPAPFTSAGRRSKPKDTRGGPPFRARPPGCGGQGGRRTSAAQGLGRYIPGQLLLGKTEGTEDPEQFTRLLQSFQFPIEGGDEIGVFLAESGRTVAPGRSAVDDGIGKVHHPLQ